MSNVLYFVPMTRASRPRWVLEELGLPYDLHQLEVADTKKPEYLAVHPLGRVPAFVQDGVTFLESAAICMHLADQHPYKGLAPELGSVERGHYYQWILFSMASLEPHLTQLTTLRMSADEDPAALEKELASTRAHLEVLEKAIANREFIVGDHFTVADVVVSSTVAWARALGATEGFTQCEAYSKRMLSRPAAKRARH